MLSTCILIITVIEAFDIIVSNGMYSAVLPSRGIYLNYGTRMWKPASGNIHAECTHSNDTRTIQINTILIQKYVIGTALGRSHVTGDVDMHTFLAPDSPAAEAAACRSFLFSAAAVILIALKCDDGQ